MTEAIECAHLKLLEKLEKVPPKHDKLNESLRAIRSHRERHFGGGYPKVSAAVKSKLIALYETAARQCRSEADAVRVALAALERRRAAEFDAILGSKMSRGQLIKVLAEQARTLPLFIGAVDGYPPHGVGAITLPARAPLEVGGVVAAFVDEVWILAKILVVMGGERYEVRDIDDEHESSGAAHSNKRIVCRRHRLIPLPRYRADPARDGHALFPHNAIVLALYPQTTCFYKGVVDRAPQTATDDYLIAFEDATFDTGYSPSFDVAQRYVVPYVFCIV